MELGQPETAQRLHQQCLTAASGNGDNGAALHMYDCQNNWASQTFYRPASRPEEVGRLRSWLGGNRCIEIADSIDGAVAQQDG